MGDHAVVGTNGLPFDVPAALQDLDGLGQAEGAALEGVAVGADLADGRQVGHQDAARTQGRLGRLDHPPGLGQVQDGPVEAGLVHPVVGVADLDAVAVQGGGAEEGGHVGPGPGGEVGSQLVSGHLGPGPQQGHGEGARTEAGLEDPGPGKHVGHDQDRAEVLGVDDLGASRHLQHHLGQGGPHGGVAGAPGRAGHPALLPPDQVVVGYRSGVGVELAAGGQVDQVAASLGVEEQDPFAGLERAAHERPVFAGGPSSSVEPPVARWTSLQKAHSSLMVGEPHPGQGCSPARSSSAWGWTRAATRSRNPK